MDLSNFLQYILPAFSCYCINALLALRSYPFAVRLGFLPATLYAMYRCAVTLDLSNGDETQMHLNQLLLVSPPRMYFEMPYELYMVGSS